MGQEPNFDDLVQRSLEHHQRLSAQTPPGPQFSPPTAPARRRRGGGFLASALSAGAVLGLVGGAFWWVSNDPNTSAAPSAAPSIQQPAPQVPDPNLQAPAPSQAPAPEASVEESDASSFKAPTPGVGEQSAPLGEVPKVQNPSDAWVALRTRDDGSPVTWSPCRPIHYVTREAGQVPGGDEMVRKALASISAHTGLQFIDDGLTDEAPVESREGFQPDRYGDRWAPVLIAWTTPEETAALNGDTIGQAGPISVWSDSSPATYVSGQVVLDYPQITESLRYPGGQDSIDAVIRHELGHLVGLGHVDDPASLMYPQTTDENENYDNGDLTGLAAMGSGACNANV